MKLSSQGQVFDFLEIIDSENLSIDFRAKPSVGQEQLEPDKPTDGLWVVILQTIITNKLGRRLHYFGTVRWGHGLNSRAVESMIIAGHFLQHTDIDTVIPASFLDTTNTIVSRDVGQKKNRVEAFSKKDLH